MELIHPSAKLLRHLRESICVSCVLRPPGSEAQPGTIARTCEPQCQIFLNVPQLIRIALSVRGTTIAPYERACNETICQQCQASPTHGDFCSERTTERCPLALYLRDAVDVIERMRPQELVAT
jgi:hypothetical protein